MEKSSDYCILIMILLDGLSVKSSQSTLAKDKPVPEWLAISGVPTKMDSMTWREEKVSRRGWRSEKPEISQGMPRHPCEKATHSTGLAGGHSDMHVSSLNHHSFERHSKTPSSSSLIHWPLKKKEKKIIVEKQSPTEAASPAPAHCLPMLPGAAPCPHPTPVPCL